MTQRRGQPSTFRYVFSALHTNSGLARCSAAALANQVCCVYVLMLAASQADEFGKNNNARAIFLSQSCPTWGTLSFPERPDSTASAVTRPLISCAVSTIPMVLHLVPVWTANPTLRLTHLLPDLDVLSSVVSAGRQGTTRRLIRSSIP